MRKNVEETWFDLSDAAIDDTFSQNTLTDDQASYFSEILKNSLDVEGDIQQYIYGFQSDNNQDSDYTRFLSQTNSKLKGILRQNDIKYANILSRSKQSSFNPIIEWEGYVTEIMDNYFMARLSRTHGEELDHSEEADIYFEDLEESDKALVKEGAVFRWSIGYVRDPKGTKRKLSQIVFRRLPAWSKYELTRASERAKKLTKLLGKNDDKAAERG